MISAVSAQWRIACDEPGCVASVSALDCQTERQAIERSIEIAVMADWQIAPDRFIRAREDLCPEHRTDTP